MSNVKHPHPLLLAALLVLGASQWLFAVPRDRVGQWATFAGSLLFLLGSGLAYRAYTARSCAVPVRHWQPSWRAQLAAGAVLTLVATTLRVLWLDQLPYKLDGDAAAFALSAVDFLGPNPPALVGTGWQSHTNLLFFLYSVMLRIFGRTIVGVRSLGALGGIVGVVAIFWLGCSVWNIRVGLLAGLVAAVLPFHMVFSRVGTEVVHMTWLLPLTTIGMLEGWQHQSRGWLLFAGAITGLSQYFYPGARLIPILLVIQLGLLAVFAPTNPSTHAPMGRWRRVLQALGWAGLGFELIYGPMLHHFWQHPEQYTARVNLVSVTSPGWIEHQLAQRPLWRVLGEQARRAYLPFLYPIGGAKLWFVWPQYLGMVDATLLAIGLIGLVVDRKIPRWLRWYLATYLGLGLLLAGVLTIDTPMPSRYVIFVPAIALLIGYGIDQSVRAIMAWQADPPFSRRAEIRHGLLIGALAAYAVSNVAAYVRHDAVDVWSVDTNNQIATYTARYLLSLPDQEFDIYFLQTPLMYFEASPTLPFLLDKPGTNLSEPISCATLLPELRARQTVVIAPPERIAKLKQVSQDLPAAEFQIIHNPHGMEIVAVLRLAMPTIAGSMCRTIAAP